MPLLTIGAEIEKRLQQFLVPQPIKPHIDPMLIEKARNRPADALDTGILAYIAAKTRDTEPTDATAPTDWRRQELDSDESIPQKTLSGVDPRLLLMSQRPHAVGGILDYVAAKEEAAKTQMAKEQDEQEEAAMRATDIKRRTIKPPVILSPVIQKWHTLIHNAAKGAATQMGIRGFMQAKERWQAEERQKTAHEMYGVTYDPSPLDTPEETPEPQGHHPVTLGGIEEAGIVLIDTRTTPQPFYYELGEYDEEDLKIANTNTLIKPPVTLQAPTENADTPLYVAASEPQGRATQPLTLSIPVDSDPRKPITNRLNRRETVSA